MAQVKIKQLPRRQRIRKTLLLVSLLLLPVTLYYFSPAIILQGASEGIVTGSFIVFGLMFISSLFVGRLWCGWACPTGALQELVGPINNRRTARWTRWTKYAIWLPWLGLLAGLIAGAGGIRRVDPFYQLDGGATMAIPYDGSGPPWYMVYYVIIALFSGLAVVVGRRAACHTVCWMAPFMVVGRRIRNLVKWPALRLKGQPDTCINCKRCTSICPMSLDVYEMVQRNQMEDDECILCGSCVDECPRNSIRYAFSGGK